MTDIKLDISAGLLISEGIARKLRPKTLAVLVALIERQGDVVCQQDLRGLVWGNRHGSDAGPKQCVRELRRLLGDDASAAGHIETVGRQGYRLLGRIEVIGAGESQPKVDHALCVGRDPEIAALTEGAALARRGGRPVVLIAGEAGAGKTRLTDRFLASLPQNTPIWTARGQSIPHPGARETFGPLLESLSQISASAAGPALGRLLRSLAPSWADQVPGQGHTRTPSQIEAARPESMLREFSDLMERLTLDLPGILVLEDLHWADPSTLAWLTAWGLRGAPARLLVVATYRYDEVDRSGDLTETLLHLNRRSETRVLTLGGLSPAAVQDYLDGRFPGNRFPPSLAPALARRTEGHAILIDAAVGRWLEQGDILKADGRWALREEAAVLVSTMSASVADFIANEIGRLDPDERALLESASIAGPTFSSLPLADDRDTMEACERQLADLAGGRRFIGTVGNGQGPDGMAVTRFAFRHALFHEALYNGIPAGIRQGLHRRAGMRLERAYGRHAPDIAPTLANHFEQGADLPRAAQYRGLSGLLALGRGAGQDAAAQLRAALALHARCSAPSGDLQAAELRSLLGLGAALIVSDGFTGGELQSVFSRARTLAEAGGDPVAILPVLAGYWNYHISRAELSRARELAEAMDRMKDAAPRHIAMAVHNAVGQIDLFRGAFGLCLPRIGTVLAMATDADRDGAETELGEHPVIVCNKYAAFLFQVLGREAEAEAYFASGMEEADIRNQPFGQAQMLWAGAVIARLRGDTALTLERAGMLIDVCETHDVPYWRPAAEMLSGWARVMQGDTGGFATFRTGQAAYEARNVRLTLPFSLGLSAQMAARTGEPSLAARTLRRAILTARRSGERWYEAELYRQWASLMVEGGRPDQARRALGRAIDCAAAQGASGFEISARAQLAAL